MTGWQWDASLYEGSAPYYARGRVGYPPELVDAIVAGVAADGTGRLLDVGCGPGSLTLLLAPRFERAVGLDADAAMLAEAARQASAAGVGNAQWVHARAEALPADLGRFHVVTLAQSFHWMDRPRVAALLHGALVPDGALVHVHATTHEGVDGAAPLAHPRPPRREIAALIERHLGSRRRAGQGTLPEVVAAAADVGRTEDAIYRGAGFTRRTRLEIAGSVVTRSADEVVAGVFSLSSAAPHLFGDRLDEFESQLRELLARVAADGRFCEQMRGSAVDIWRG